MENPGPRISFLGLVLAHQNANLYWQISQVSIAKFQDALRACLRIPFMMDNRCVNNLHNTLRAPSSSLMSDQTLRLERIVRIIFLIPPITFRGIDVSCNWAGV
jgi:hypothetical protein